MRTCVVSDCGARLKGDRLCNPKNNTCSPSCTRARNNGLTREAQLISEMEQQERHAQKEERLGYTFHLKYK